MWSKERLSITSARQNTSILKQKLLFITIMDSRDMYYKQALNFRMHQHSIQRFRIFNFIENFFSKCGQRMADSDAGEGNKNLEYSSKFIRQILLQETLRKTSPFLHWINIPQNWSRGTFGIVLFLSLCTLRGGRCFVKRLPRGSTADGPSPERWTADGGPGQPSMGRSWFPVWGDGHSQMWNHNVLALKIESNIFTVQKQLESNSFIPTQMYTVDSFCGQDAPNCPSLDTWYLMFGEGLQNQSHQNDPSIG